MAQILDIWMSSKDRDLKHISSWAISQQSIINRDLVVISGDRKKIQDFIQNEVNEANEANEEDIYGASCLAPLIIGFYMGSPWTDEELRTMVASVCKNEKLALFRNVRSKCESLLHVLGDAGIGPLKEPKGERQEGKRKNVGE